MAKKSLTKREQELIKRYLVWCYKTTKEDLDRIDRYFTQNMVDQILLKELKKSKSIKKNAEYEKLVKKFDGYMDVKLAKALDQKFVDKSHKALAAEYEYLQNRFKGIEKSICYFLGKKELSNICDLYEEEMTLRIFEAREH